MWYKGGGGLAVLLALISLLSACGGTRAPAGQEAVEVRVQLLEMKIVSSVDAFSVGVPYRFVVTNQGTIPHELMIVPPMMDIMMRGTMSMEELDTLALAHIEVSDLPPGATQTLDYIFTTPAPQGTLELACYVPGHYEAGMKLPIVVR